MIAFRFGGISLEQGAELEALWPLRRRNARRISTVQPARMSDDRITNWLQINRFAANRQNRTEPELASVALMLITLPNGVAAIELGTAAAAAVVRPLFFLSFSSLPY